MDLPNLLTIIFFLAILKPITSRIIIAFIFLFLLLICSALMSGSEMAFFSLSPKKIDELKNKKTKNAQHIFTLLENPQKLLATLLIGNNFINISIVIIATYITVNLFDLSGHYVLSFLLEFIVITSLILLFGEILPKIYASQKAINFAHFMAKPLIILEKIFHPLSSILVKSTSTIEKKLSQKKQQISFDELSEAIEITSDAKTQQQERKILKGIVKFSDIEVSEIMKPRTDVVAVEYSTKYSQLISFIRENGFSRIPVYHKTFDHIKGILYIKDLLPYLDMKTGFKWQNLIRPPFYVPENMKISDLLGEFKSKKIHLAIVVDEYGGTSGIITLEDIIEEIVGDINDEYDVESDEYFCRKIDDNNFIFDGKTSLNDLAKKININPNYFEETKGEADSLAGLILEITGKIPQNNDIVELKDLLFTIISSDNRRIKRVKITLKANESTIYE